jgi:catechol 2,3-dioxygenase-like lactoylglutathione lyase family enzyme
MTGRATPQHREDSVGCDWDAQLVAHLETARRKPRLTFLAPEFLVDDLARSIAYYQKLGFTFGKPWDGFYASGLLDGLEFHLKEAPKNADERGHRRANEHLDASAGVDDIVAFYAQCAANGATIIKPHTATPWSTKDFYIEDPVAISSASGVARPLTERRAGFRGPPPER